MPFFEDWSPFHISADIRDKLLRISPATIDRSLKSDKKKLSLTGKNGTKPGKLIDKKRVGATVRSETPFPRSTTGPAVPTRGSWLPLRSLRRSKGN
ncbi:MAG: hypothetical protein LBD96_09270 [Treponema sp.]|jgi:hypothetical protein|nr:hypothetical protein [Treponema sp.]